MIHHTRENITTASESSGDILYTNLTPGLSHSDLRFACRCSAMTAHFMKLPTNSSCANVFSRGSLKVTIKALTVHRSRSSRENFMNRLLAKVASYERAVFQVTELFSKTHFHANVYLLSSHGYVLDFMHVSNGCV